MPAASPRVLTSEARKEWDALEADHAALRTDFDRLLGQHPVSVPEHEDLKARLAAHLLAVAAWRERHFGQH